jgi:hypothetical protein
VHGELQVTEAVDTESADTGAQLCIFSPFPISHLSSQAMYCATRMQCLA